MSTPALAMTAARRFVNEWRIGWHQGRVIALQRRLDRHRRRVRHLKAHR